MEGKIIKQKLVSMNITQLELANRLEMTPQSLSSILHAKDVRSGTIERIAQVLNVPVSFLYGENNTNLKAVANGNKSVAAINSKVSAENNSFSYEELITLRAENKLLRELQGLPTKGK